MLDPRITPEVEAELRTLVAECMARCDVVGLAWEAFYAVVRRERGKTSEHPRIFFERCFALALREASN